MPWNPFAIGGVTPEALGYLQVPGLQQGKIEQEVYQAIVTGDLGAYGIQSPAASESIKVAFGIEQRYDRLSNVTDDPTSQFLLSGTGGPTIGLTVRPRCSICSPKSGCRWCRMPPSRTSSGWSWPTATPTTTRSPPTRTRSAWIGRPVQDVRFRASYQRAVRAPNVVELFTSQGFNLFDLPGDPCGADLAGHGRRSIGRGVSRDGRTACATSRTRRPRQPGWSVQLPAGCGDARPGLVPETSDTYTYGVILQPSFLPKLAMSIDYFDIEIEDALTPRGPDSTLNGCYFGNDADVLFPHPAQRQRLAVARYWSRHRPQHQHRFDHHEGYRPEHELHRCRGGIGLGELSFNLVGTYLDELTYDIGIPGIAPVECKGKFSGALCGIPNPDWRHHFRVGWETPWNVDLALTWRYYAAVTNIVPATAANIDYELGCAQLLRPCGNWAVTEKSSVILGINNVLDKDPPITSAVGTTGNGNTFPQTYDALGRWIFLRGQVSF